MSRISRLVSFSLENETIIGDEEALNDASVHTDIVTDVEIPANNISEIIDEMEDAEENAQSLENTAELLNRSIEIGEDVSSLSIELIQEKLSSVVERYQLDISFERFSKESFSLEKSRIIRTISSETYETSHALRTEIVKAFIKILLLLKNLLVNWLGMHGRLQRRVKKLKEKYQNKWSEVDPSLCKIKASRLGSPDLFKEVEKLYTFSTKDHGYWFHFIEFDAYGNVIRNNSLSGVNVFRSCGGSLGGRSIKIAQTEDHMSYKLIIEDVAERFSNTTIKGVTKEQGLRVLTLLEKALYNYKPLEKEIKTYIRNIDNISRDIIDMETKKPISLKATIKKRSVANTLNKLVSSVLTTYLRVISVSSQVCSQCLK